jgi:cytochrome c
MCNPCILVPAILVCAFLVPARAGQPAQGRGPVKGKAAFAQCAVCHDAASNTGKLGPGLKGMFKRAKLAKGKPVNDGAVRSVIEEGGSGMPPYRHVLSEDEKDALVVYLKTL